MRVGDAARAAFGIGYASATALHPVGMTERARITLAAAIDRAEHSPEHAATVVEATLILGQLEGVWAAIYDRRLQVIDDGLKELLGRWRELAPDLAALAAHHVGPAETTAPPDPTLAALAASLLSPIRTDPKLVELLSKWLSHAFAEGRVGALALAADTHGVIGFDFALAFEDAVKALGRLDHIDAAALAGIEQAVDGTVTDLAKRMSALVAQGAPYSTILDDLQTLFSDARAASYWLDVALSAGLTQGAMDLYQSEGVTEIEWVTAGDARVCAECQAEEDGNPWPIGSAPQPPEHGRCRCCIQTNDQLPAALWGQYTTDGGSDG